MENLSKEEKLEMLLADVENLLEELFQSGFDTVHDSTLEAMENMTKLTEQYGMAYLSELLEALTRGLAMRRHQLEKKQDGMAGLYAKLNEYIYLCKEKTACDRGRNYYAPEE